MNRTKKTIYNTSVMMLYEVVTVVCSLILPRLLLVGFGSDVNGLVSSITKFLGYISFLRLGVAGSTRVALYKSLADSSDRAIYAENCICSYRIYHCLSSCFPSCG